MKQKGFAPILIVVLIAAVLGGYLIYQRQNKSLIAPQVAQPVASSTATPESSFSADISDWKTYTSNKLQYSFQSPANLEITSAEPDPTKEDQFINSTTVIRMGSDSLGIIVKKINPNYNPTPCEQTKQGCIGDKGGYGGSYTEPVAKQIKVRFGNQELDASKKVYQTGYVEIFSKSPIKSKESSATYSISLSSAASSNRELFSKILSTFKFLP